MDYLYENLGDERFQEFCSNLISKEYPNFQAFPVGQPDGGRDTIIYNMDSLKKEFIIFQVKFVKNANEERDLHKWLIEILKKEAPKVDKLIPKGAKRYFLMTNVRGTAHLDSGSKDQINQILEENIAIPSLCWWRDDITVLFEKDPLFKWSFPEILTGQDVINSMLFEGIQENKERRLAVITAYLSDQFDVDNEVKFRQIDLQNKLFDLFTDVPLAVKKINNRNKELKLKLNRMGYESKSYYNDDSFIIEEKKSIGASEFILNNLTQYEIERILIEGGPGQGKSTISQYVCQVHRTRILNKSFDLSLLPANIRNSPVRLPFKIDLRDVASWVEKKNPYKDSISQNQFDSAWKNSLEAFLIIHIFYHSKLEEFTSVDLVSVLKASPILFVFDGFDEIANIKVRSEVIDFINKGINRITSNTKSIQVIVTSRPSAFSDSVGFSIDNYPHFELTDITKPIINEYIDKWIKARKLLGRDASDLKKLMNDKLELPHLKELTKSPMQLAIFITLLRIKGQSLPDKRTSLYDNYIELFFDRESDKNNLVRDKRELIIYIHQYLAWILHSEAELYKTSGSIHINDLSVRLKEYLRNEGHDPQIADQLFDVMKERVCALVSRVQGTFEFEVQPLREYFCAKYLYTSAPYSSAGNVMTGTKPDRLHAILRSFYWQNVVRFFTGCADAGELDMIIQELKDLQEDASLKFTNYPKLITSQILSDYVFSQKPLKLKSVVEIILNGINAGSIINQDFSNSSTEPLLLPNECGRQEVVKECFKQLSKFPKLDYAEQLIGLINNNPHHVLDTWLEYVKDFSGSHLTIWLEYGYKLQLSHKIDEQILRSIVNEGNIFEKRKRLAYIIAGNRIDLVDGDLSLKEIVFEEIFNGEISFIERKSIRHSLSFLTMILNPFLVQNLIERTNGDEKYIQYLNRFYNRMHPISEENIDPFSFVVNDKIDTIISQLAYSVRSLLDFPMNEFKHNLDIWDKLIQQLSAVSQSNICLYTIATIVAGIKDKQDEYDSFSDLTDANVSLCKRVRHARLKSGNIKYWDVQLSESKDHLLSLLVFFTWGTPKAILNSLSTLDSILDKVDTIMLANLEKCLTRTSGSNKFTRSQQVYIEKSTTDIVPSNKIKLLLSKRMEETYFGTYVYTRINTTDFDSVGVKDSKLNYLILKFLDSPIDNKILKEIKLIYMGLHSFRERYHYRYTTDNYTKMSIDIARIIMQDCINYPRVITSLAEKRCRLHANKVLEPIGAIAKRDLWF